MTDTYRVFVQTVIDNIKKNGFPDKKVAFPLEQLYEAAEQKGINFNKVLSTLDDIQIAHTKTPEKITFYPKDKEPKPPATGSIPDLLKNLDPNLLSELGAAASSGDGDSASMMGAAMKMIQNLNPEQLASIKDMYEDMSEEDRAALMENAKKFGLF